MANINKIVSGAAITSGRVCNEHAAKDLYVGGLSGVGL